MGFRTYDPGRNRFLTRDLYNGALADLQLGTDPWTLNRYAFAGGNPLSLVELDGHMPAGCTGTCLRSFGMAQTQAASDAAVLAAATARGQQVADNPELNAIPDSQPAPSGPSLRDVLNQIPLPSAKKDQIADAIRHNPCGILDPETTQALTNGQGVPPVSTHCIVQAAGLQIGLAQTDAGVVIAIPTIGVFNLSSGGGSGPAGRSTPGSGRDVIQNVAQRIADKGRAYLDSLLSAAQRAALARIIQRSGAGSEEWLRRLFYGSKIHELVGRELRASYGNRFLSNATGPDFTDLFTGENIELTTTNPGAIVEHLDRGGAYMNALYAVYNLPPP